MSQIKSKDRVRDLAEVYTNEREVNAMLDLIPLNTPDDIIRYRYLEPACGNGNFLIEILRRKLARVTEKYAAKSLRIYEFYIARALTTIYGIDICYQNVQEARERLYREIKSTVDFHKGSFVYSDGFFGLVRYILSTNIVQGDSINAPDDIVFVEYTIKGHSFGRRLYRYSHLVKDKPRPLKRFDPVHFLALGMDYEGNQRHLDFV
jgi:hypothetical protein